MNALEVIKILKVPCLTPLYKGLVVKITSMIMLKVPLSVFHNNNRNKPRQPFFFNNNTIELLILLE